MLQTVAGPDHPDAASTLINVAMMYQDASNMSIALRYLQEALKKNECILGPGHIQIAACYHALAIAFSCMGAYKASSSEHDTKTRHILVKQLGSDDSQTKDSKNWLKTRSENSRMLKTPYILMLDLMLASAPILMAIFGVHFTDEQISGYIVSLEAISYMETVTDSLIRDYNDIIGH